MLEEMIILLVKEKQYEPAIQIFVENGQYKQAEEFCNQRPQLALMSFLLKIYFDKYNYYEKEKKSLISEKRHAESSDMKEEANKFKR